MAGQVTVDSLIAMLRDEGSKGTEKVAFSKSDVADTSNAELLNKIAEDMDADEVLKQAAAARVSGNIMAELILEKVAGQLAPSIANTLHEKIASLLPHIVREVVPAAVQVALEKIAVGTSSVISGYGMKSVPNDSSAGEHQIEEDKIGKKMGDRTSKYWGADETSGATVSGGGAGALEGGGGEKPEAWQPVHKLSAAKSEASRYLINSEKEKDAYLAQVENNPAATLEDYRKAKTAADKYMKSAEQKAAEFMKKAELEQDVMRYQELQAKKAAGALTPEEEQELQMLEQKLMAAAGAGGGAPPGAGAPGDAGPPGGGMPDGGAGGGAPMMAPGGSMGSFGDGNKTAAVKKLLQKYNLGKSA